MSERSRTAPRRSCLSVPGSSARMLAKAPGLAADMVFVDLEDSVAPLEKDAARPAAAAAVREGEWGDRVVGIRVNAWDTPWTHLDVVGAVAAAGDRLDVVVLPKVGSPTEVAALDLLLTQVERNAGREVGGIGVEVQIESAAGLADVARIAAASPRVETLILGPIDLSASLELPGPLDGSALPASVRVSLLVAARAAGVQVIDGPCTAVRDADAGRAHFGRSRDLGYDGAWVLHPDQIALANEVYTPDPEAFARAVQVLDAYAGATTTGDRRGAVMFGDEMIDEASRKLAARTVERGRRAGL
ncbi:MAG: CoA ester lyase [Acidimicrobiia bacterium]